MCGSISNITEMIVGGLRSLPTPGHPLHQNYLEKEHHRLLNPRGSDRSFDFQGRRLEFCDTPFAHNAGVLHLRSPTRPFFPVTLFGSFSREWELYLHLRLYVTMHGDYR
jgi:hypothetical protein